MADLPVLGALGLGFLLGARHALDADHIAAVSTILARRPNLRASGFIGFCWGVGHATVLLIVGLLVLALKITIPVHFMKLFEFTVGIMLVVLGASLALTLVRGRWHLHVHDHDGEAHLHLHRHQDRMDHDHGHWWRASWRPVVVGMVHGLAGSAALLLMVLSTLQTLWQGVLFIAIFGIGSILGMMVLGILISLPLVLSLSFGRSVQAALQGLASLGSIGLGLSMMLRFALGDRLF